MHGSVVPAATLGTLDLFAAIRIQSTEVLGEGRIDACLGWRQAHGMGAPHHKQRQNASCGFL